MPFRTLAICSPEQPSSGPSLARPSARAVLRPSAVGEEVIRRVSLPGALDKAIEARRDVTGESRDEAIASLLRAALRGGGEEKPEAVTPDLGELSAAAVALSEITRGHRAWLLEHHATLDETHRAASGAITDLQEFAATTREIRSGLSAVLRAIEITAEKERTTIAHALQEATGKAQEQLELARNQVASAQAQISAFEEARSLHLEGLKGHIERYRRLLKLTPTVAVSFVGVACVLAVLVSIVFVPTFQKFTEDAFVQRQIAPVVRDEIKKSFEVLRSENEAQTKAFFDLENERFEKFATHYRKQIDSLKGDKIALADENKNLTRLSNATTALNEQWKKYAQSLESENASLKKTPLKRMCGSLGEESSGRASLGLLLLPLVLVFASQYSRQKRV